MVRAFNTWAISLVRHSTRIGERTPEELDRIDEDEEVDVYELDVTSQGECK